MQAVEACLARHPGHPQALCVKALLLQRQNRHQEAEALLRKLIEQNPADANVRISSRHLLAVSLDQLGHYDEALRWLLESKNLLGQTANVVKMQADYDRADRFRRELLAQLTPQSVPNWRERIPRSSSNRWLFSGDIPAAGPRCWNKSWALTRRFWPSMNQKPSFSRYGIRSHRCKQQRH